MYYVYTTPPMPQKEQTTEKSAVQQRMGGHPRLPVALVYSERNGRVARREWRDCVSLYHSSIVVTDNNPVIIRLPFSVRNFCHLGPRSQHLHFPCIRTPFNSRLATR